jgi:O-antigen/teichoic acid export membrane protein
MSFSLKKKIQNLSLIAGTDLAIRRALINKVWSVIAGPIGLLMAARFLTKEEQGFLYTFASIQALQVFFELGLTFIIMQFASHEKGHLEWSDFGTLEGKRKNKERLASILRLSTKWYSAISLLLAITLPWIGIWFFSWSKTSIHWFTPWILVSISTSLTLLTVPITGILEGCGKLAEVYGNGLVQTIASTLAYWLALSLGAGLYSPSIQWAVSIVIGISWVFRRFRHFLIDLWKTEVSPSNQVSWRREMWPIQWKISLSWASGYFLFQLATPIIFRSLGPAVAGQFGMTQRLISTIQNVGHTWINTKAATFGSLHARGQHTEVRKLLRHSLLMSLLFILLLSTGFLATLAALPHLGFSALADRFVKIPTALIMCLNLVVYIPIFSIATFARSQKKEPFVWCSIVAALVSAPLLFYVAPHFGTQGFASMPLLVNLLLVLPWSLAIYRVASRH